MKGRDKNRKPRKNPSHRPRKIKTSCIFVYTLDFSDGLVASPMTHFFFSTTRPFRVRASNNAIARFHDYPFGGSRSTPLNDGHEVITNSEAWFVKVVCTLCVHKHSLDTCLDYFSGRLTPFIAFEVIRRLNNPDLALRFFEFSRVNLRLNHYLRTYDMLMRSLCQMGLHESAKAVFDCMRSDGHWPGSSIVGFLVLSFAQGGKFGMAKGLLAQVQSEQLVLSSFLYNKLLSLLVKRNQVDEALCFFREYMGEHSHCDTWSFNILIGGLCRVGEVKKAFELFNDMGNFGCLPDLITYNSLISGLCRAHEVDRAQVLLKEIQSQDDFSPDVVTYTSVIQGYCKLGKMEEASAVFQEMISSGTKPNTITFNVLIDGFGKAGDMISALTMHEKMLFLGCLPDVITFTSLIEGYCRSGQVDQGLKLWHEMGASNLSPNEYTFSILISALCKENRLHEACDFLRQLTWRNCVPQPFIYNPVIDGFCKAGNVDEANVIVAEMEQKRCNHDKMTYTILIIGHCMKGRMLEAISIFNKMLATGCAPDTITMRSFIPCLLKAGMPNEASRIVHIMSEDLNLDLSSSKRTTPLRTNMDIPVAI